MNFALKLWLMRSGQLKVSEVALESFLTVSVSCVASRASFIDVIEVKIHLSVKDTFEKSLVNLSDNALFTP